MDYLSDLDYLSNSLNDLDYLLESNSTDYLSDLNYLPQSVSIDDLNCLLESISTHDLNYSLDPAHDLNYSLDPAHDLNYSLYSDSAHDLNYSLCSDDEELYEEYDTYIMQLIQQKRNYRFVKKSLPLYVNFTPFQLLAFNVYNNLYMVDEYKNKIYVCENFEKFMKDPELFLKIYKNLKMICHSVRIILRCMVNYFRTLTSLTNDYFEINLCSPNTYNICTIYGIIASFNILDDDSLYFQIFCDQTYKKVDLSYIYAFVHIFIHNIEEINEQIKLRCKSLGRSKSDDTMQKTKTKKRKGSQNKLYAHKSYSSFI